MEGWGGDNIERDRESPHDGDEQSTTGYPVAPLLIPADVLASRFAKYAASYKQRAESLPWWRRWQRGLFFGAFAALKLEGEDLADLARKSAPIAGE